MNLSYRVFGEGKPLIILHGLFGSSDNWQTHAKRLSTMCKVVLVDQRNHGHAPHLEEMNYDAIADDLLELAAHEGLRDIILLGHSMGGKSAMRFAQKSGFLVDALIVADMGIKGYPRHHDLIFKGLNAVDVDNCDSRKTAEGRLSTHIQDESTMQFLMKNLYWKEPGKLAWRFNLAVLESHIDEILVALPEERIDCETLFIVGGKSGYVLPEDHESIRERIPLVHFETIAEAGHWVHAEAPVQFLEIVESFIQQRL
jgi:pimeloyl-ACP methyl ester carboxylesterase